MSMRTPGVFTCHEHIIKVKSTKDPICFVPFGDVHYGAPLHARHEFARFCAWAKKQKNAVFLGMGDYTEAYSTSEREIVRHLHESNARTDKVRMAEMCDDLYEKIEFMKGRCIGLIEGNHFGYVGSGGQTTTEYLCNRLEAPYLGTCSHIKLRIDYHGSETTVAILVHHGKGAGSTPGGSLNAVAKFGDVMECDIAIMGDDHHLGFWMDAKLDRKDKEVLQKPIAYIRSGSFLKGYEHGEASYIVDRAGRPRSLGWQPAYLHLRRNKSEGFVAEVKSYV